MKGHLYAYKAGSESARLVSEALGIKRIKHKNSRFKGRKDKVVINWGASEVPEEVDKCHIINTPECVAVHMDKRRFFDLHDGSGITPPHTFFRDDVVDKLQFPVVCRTKVQAKEGEGIVIADTEEELVDAPLYVQYIKKKQEWRVHIAFGEVIDLQRKMRSKKVEDVDWRVRNHNNGFVFRRFGLAPPPRCVLQVASDAMERGMLDFGAVDVVYNAYHDRAYVLEVNTAPGIEGTSIENYRVAFEQHLK